MSLSHEWSSSPDLRGLTYLVHKFARKRFDVDVFDPEPWEDHDKVAFIIGPLNGLVGHMRLAARQLGQNTCKVRDEYAHWTVVDVGRRERWDGTFDPERRQDGLNAVLRKCRRHCLLEQLRPVPVQSPVRRKRASGRKRHVARGQVRGARCEMGRNIVGKKEHFGLISIDVNVLGWLPISCQHVPSNETNHSSTQQPSTGQ